MKAISVDDAEAVTWQVQVDWRPRMSGLMRKYGGWRRKDLPDAPTLPDAGSGRAGGPDFDEGIPIVVALFLLLLAAVLVFVLMWWAVIPALLLVVDVVLVIVALVAGTVAKVLFRRPWTVLAASERGDRVTRSTVGWRRALRERDNLVEQLRMGALRTHEEPTSRS